MADISQLASTIRRRAASASGEFLSVAELRRLAFPVVPTATVTQMAASATDALASIKPYLDTLDLLASGKTVKAEQLERFCETFRSRLDGLARSAAGERHSIKGSRDLDGIVRATLFEVAAGSVTELARPAGASNARVRKCIDLLTLAGAGRVGFRKSEEGALGDFRKLLIERIEREHHPEVWGRMSARSTAVIDAAREAGIRVPRPESRAQIEDFAVGLEAIHPADLNGRKWTPVTTFFYDDAGLCSLIQTRGNVYKKVAGVVASQVSNGSIPVEVLSYSATGEIERRNYAKAGQWIVWDPNAERRGPAGEPNRWVVDRIDDRYDVNASVVTADCDAAAGERYFRPVPSFVAAIDNTFGPLVITHEDGSPKYADLAGNTSALACDLRSGRRVREAVRTIPNPDRARFVDREGMPWAVPPSYLAVPDLLLRESSR